MPSQPLSNYLKMYRKRSGLSQDELAFVLGCRSGSKVSRYERGGRLPSHEAAIALELVFGIDSRELFSGLHSRIYGGVRRRAQRLSRRVDAQPLTPSIKRKLDFLVEVVHQRRTAA